MSAVNAVEGFLPLFEEQRQDPIWPDRPRYLLSYAYVNGADMDTCRRLGVDLVIDSGAFTTAASGKQMDHEAYLEWLLEHADLISFALSYDVIGDHHASRVNHDIAVETIGDKVKMVPTWHLGSPMDELHRLCRSYDFVSIGGAVPFAKSTDMLATIAGQCHRVAREYGTKLHGLGMTGNRILHGFPWYSVDSSAWLSSARFPSFPLADRNGVIQQFEHGCRLDNLARALVRQYGGDPAVVAQKGWSLKASVGPELAKERRYWALKASARSFMYLEAYKNAHQPQAPIKVYLSGNVGGLEGGASQVIADAHAEGDPWTTPTPLTPEDWS